MHHDIRKENKSAQQKSVRISVLGSGDAFNSGGNGHTCFLLEGKQKRLLIDCGAPALQKLKSMEISSNQIDIIAISHFHGDHIGGLPYILLDAMKEKRKEPLYIISPAGGKRIIGELTGILYPGKEAICNSDYIKWDEYRKGKMIKIDSVSIEGFEVVHALKTNPHGIKIHIDGKTIAYSGDTEYTDSLKEISKDADLFICECTFFNTHVKGHIHYTLLQKKLKELSFKRILLTHFDEEMLHRKNDVKEEMAHDGWTHEI